MTVSKTKAATTRRPTFDPLMVVMALGFALAVAGMVYPAFRANAFTAPGLILIFAAGATALIWLFAFGRAEVRRASGDTAVEMLDAMAEPAALVWPSGQVLAYNGAWAEENGAVTALPRGKSAQAVYMAFAQAREGHQGRAIVQIGAREIEVLIGQAGQGRFLVRAAPDAVLPVPQAAPVAAPGKVSGEARAMAAGAPFGSTVIAGDDLFAGKAEDSNAALALLTGPASSGDASSSRSAGKSSWRPARANQLSSAYRSSRLRHNEAHFSLHVRGGWSPPGLATGEPEDRLRDRVGRAW